ncbi:ferredoxin [Mangrovihabitans endophyticus]|uniref:Ferredoxin n=1 Tax=Mangrovihabitans endophyticus TaxID=1751298 RepID=A0A8J3BVE0_9ACTN|nr:ferredoxin [Mangrovihabitans endophyticus]GGK72939.1 hypothetical protein GCM10012284_03580 [Mangrovihabitans endophyticus]
MNEAEWRLSVDRATCIGSGMCTSSAPEYFALDDSGVSRPLAERVAPDDALLDAANSCPVEAIRVQRIPDGAVLAPAR